MAHKLEVVNRPFSKDDTLRLRQMHFRFEEKRAEFLKQQAIEREKFMKLLAAL